LALKKATFAEKVLLGQGRHNVVTDAFPARAKYFTTAVDDVAGAGMIASVKSQAAMQRMIAAAIR
jgi:hypothetical protein